MKQQITGYSHNIMHAIQFAMDHGFAIREEDDGWSLLDRHDSSEVDHNAKSGETAVDARAIRAMVLKHDSEQRNKLYRANVENRMLRECIEAHHDSEQRNELYRANVENRMLREYIEAHHDQRALEDINALINGYLAGSKK